MDGWMDGWTDRQTDRAAAKVQGTPCGNQLIGLQAVNPGIKLEA